MSNEQIGNSGLPGLFKRGFMQAPWREGDVASATCGVCGKTVHERYETRDVRMSGTRVTFSNILVGVCSECDSTISLPRQSIAQIRELSCWK
jgi:hypothetical protein